VQRSHIPTNLEAATSNWAENLLHAGKIAFASAALAVATTTVVPPPAQAMTKADLVQLSYDQVKGTGLAGRCSTVEGADSITVKNGDKLVDMCLEPTSFAIEHDFSDKRGVEKKFVQAHPITRETFTLDAVEGPLEVQNGNLVFHEQDGMDYNPVTLKDNTRGEGYPMLFNIKDLQAIGIGDKFRPGSVFGGHFNTPSYRTGLFQDPRGRGGTTGYDAFPGLLALHTGMEGDDALYKENNKVFDESPGTIEFEVDQVDDDEIGGTFVSIQKGDSDRGAHNALNILVKGVWYARVDEPV